MKLSTRFRYGFRLMLDLARNYKKGPLILKDVAKKELVSKKYLEQIVIKLIKANLVKSIRGPKGGYVLNKPPGKISTFDIYKTLEEKLLLVACLNNPAICPLVKSCEARVVYKKIQKDIDNSLSKYTLKRVVKLK